MGHGGNKGLRPKPNIAARIRILSHLTRSWTLCFGVSSIPLRAPEPNRPHPEARAQRVPEARARHPRRRALSRPRPQGERLVANFFEICGAQVAGRWQPLSTLPCADCSYRSRSISAVNRALVVAKRSERLLHGHHLFTITNNQCMPLRVTRQRGFRGQIWNRLAGLISRKQIEGELAVDLACRAFEYEALRSCIQSFFGIGNSSP